MKKSFKILILRSVILIGISFTFSYVKASSSYAIINTYPHNPSFFTQGLVFEDGFLYEGTGIRGKSALYKIELETGRILKTHKLTEEFFGEGITIYKDKIIQLTWQSNTGFVYDKNSFELLKKFNYPTQGWGITHDNEHLIMSDGSSALYFLCPETFKEVKQIKVYDDGGPITQLNELEYINGEIFANILGAERIARISPETGRIIGWLELKGLKPQSSNKPVGVLNGIAYDKNSGRLFVTGKLWPQIFEITVNE
ncbi:MAG: glutaminyl-peptide cyclotransferase [Candidatus Omnitrophota bacterium]